MTGTGSKLGVLPFVGLTADGIRQAWIGSARTGVAWKLELVETGSTSAPHSLARRHPAPETTDDVGPEHEAAQHLPGGYPACRFRKPRCAERQVGCVLTVRAQVMNECHPGIRDAA